MSEQEPNFGRDEPGASGMGQSGMHQSPGESTDQPGPYDPFRRAPFAPTDAPEGPPDPAATGEQAPDVLDDLLSHAAQTVETLLGEVKASHEELARHESGRRVIGRPAGWRTLTRGDRRRGPDRRPARCR